MKSERQQDRELRREGMSSYTGENVFTINAVPLPGQDKGRMLRVAGYVRVSTDDPEQIVSVELQKSEIPQKVAENPNWVYVGQYVDEGRSGTNTEKRPAFNLLIEDCLAGHIDMVYTKSVSRFARNLRDCIDYVNQLKAHNPPIGIFFEAEHFNTLDASSVMLLFVLALVAEEESHMKSEAMLISLEARFKVGRFLLPKLLGYDSVKDENGRRHLEVNKDEAKTIRLIFYLFLNGETVENIADTLTELGRVSGSGRTKWTPCMVVGYMRNERYCGDVLARKTWTPDFHYHLSKKNNGRRNRHFHPGHHEAIVTRAQWNAAQRILNSLPYGHQGCYLPMSVIDHGALCGFISINLSWAGYDANDCFMICNAAMDQECAGLVDLENEYLPDEGHALKMVAKGNGIYKNTRDLTDEEREFEAKMKGEEKMKETPKSGYQIVRRDMFSKAFEPILRFTRHGLLFNNACLDKIPAGAKVELLLHPARRLLMIRPLLTETREVRNSFIWGKNYQRTPPFCKTLYQIMMWEDWCQYSVSPIVMKGLGGDNKTFLLFDLDNWYGKVVKNKKKADSVLAKPSREADESTKGIYIPPDATDGIEIKSSDDNGEEEAAIVFGELFTREPDYFSGLTLDDLLAAPKPLDGNHKVDETEVIELWMELEEEKRNADNQEPV